MKKGKPIALLVRHGDTTLTDDDIVVSRIDVSLNEDGERQTREVLDCLREYDVECIYSSPLIRCLSMAEAFAEGREVIQHRGLLPWSRGVLTGIPVAEAEDMIDLLLKNPNVRVPLGESRIECEDRIMDFFSTALAEAENKVTAFFTHHTVIDFLAYLLDGERPDDPPNIVDVGGIAAVYIDGDGYSMEPILAPSGAELDTVS